MSCELFFKIKAVSRDEVFQKTLKFEDTSSKLLSIDYGCKNFESSRTSGICVATVTKQC